MVVFEGGGSWNIVTHAEHILPRRCLPVVLKMTVERSPSINDGSNEQISTKILKTEVLAGLKGLAKGVLRSPAAEIYLVITTRAQGKREGSSVSGAQ